MHHKPKPRILRRRLIAEQLERRDLLASDLPFQNPVQRFDVNQDLRVSALDALVAINFLARNVDPSTLPAANEEGRFPDVNGNGAATALDALQVINRLAVSVPTISGRLEADSALGGTTNFDLVTQGYSFEFGITKPELGDEIEARINGSATDPFVSIGTLLDLGTMRLSETAIDQVAGSPLSDGDHRFEIRIVGQTETQEFVVTVDRAAPNVTVALNDTVRQTIDSFDLLSDEPIVTDVTMPDLFQLAVSGGPNDGTSVLIESVDLNPLPNTTRIHFSQSLADEGYRFEVNSPLSDAAGNEATIGATLFAVADPAGIREVSPAAGETLVSVNRETIVRFDEAVDPDSITGGGNSLIVSAAPAGSSGAPPISVIAGGQRLAGRLVVSSTERFATFYYDQPLPASTEVRIVVDGDAIIGRDGLPLDADGDGLPGGKRNADFRTLPIGPVVGTNIFGFVKDSATDEPIVGATIRVDNFPAKNVVTDSQGRFELIDLPAPQVFVHIDGTTATNLPAGFIYPNVGKPFHSTAGQSVQLNNDGEVFDIFLPRLKETDFQDLSATETVSVGIGDDGKGRLAEIFPNTDPAMFDLFELRIQPGAAVDDFGNTATRAAIIPVEPDRIPAPLPSFLDPLLVVSIQVPGATSFDVPAEITFPNLEGLAPGEQAQIFSFDHDKGEWELIGTGTVSPDGLSIVSDGGVIQAPGWHDIQGGATVQFKDEDGTEEGDDEPSVSIFGTNTLFSGSLQKSEIFIRNTSDVPVTLDLKFDNLDGLAELSTNVTTITLGPHAPATIKLTAREVTDENIRALQDDDPNTVNAKIITGSINIVARAQGETLENETFLYGLVAAEDGILKFPVPLDEEIPEPGETGPVEQERKTIHVEVTGPVNEFAFNFDEEIEFAETADGVSFDVAAVDLVAALSNPSGILKLFNDDGELGDVRVNAADAFELDPIAIRRVSGTIVGNIAKRNFTINGAIEIGLAGPVFTPAFRIDGSFIVTPDEFRLVGKLSTDLLDGVLGYGKDIVLIERAVLSIDPETLDFTFNPKENKDDKESAAEPKQFSLAGMKVTLTDMFFPASGIGIGIRGSVTLPDKLGNVVIDVGSGDNTNQAIIITPGDVSVTGGMIAFPDVDFSLFGVDAKATDLSLEYQQQGIDDQGVPRGDRLLVRGELELKFPKFDPDLRIAASFASPENPEDALIDLDETLGPAWAFALAEQPALAGIDAAADAAPDVLDTPSDSFIQIERLIEGGIGLDAIGRLAISNVKIGKVVTIKDAFLSIDTINDNYLGFARVETSLKKAGELTALLGFQGGEIDLVAAGLGNLNGGIGFPIGSTPLFLQSIGGGLKDLSQGRFGFDLIAAITATVGPSNPQLFPGFTLPSFLGGFEFEGADLLRIDVGGNIGLDELNLGGQVVVGGDADGGLIKGVGKIAVNFNDPSLKIEASLEALGGLVTIKGLGGQEFATLTVNSNFDLTATGRAITTLPDDLPFGLGWAEGQQLGSSSAAFKFSNDGVSENDFLAYWGEVPIFINPLNGNIVTATAGLQVFIAAKFPNLITSNEEAQQIGGAAEGEFTGDAQFELPSGKQYSIFSVEWETSAPDAQLVLVDPSGTAFTEDQFASNPNIFVLNSSDTSRDVAINAPGGGTWTVRVVDSVLDDLGNVQFAASVDSPPPTVDVTSATFDTDQLTVTFDTVNTSEDALVTVFLDSDRNDFNGTLLANDLAVASDGSGTTTVDIGGLDLPAGDYFVYAQLDEPGKPLSLSEYFVTGFMVSDPSVLPAVEEVGAQWIGGNQLEVFWDALVGADAYVIRVSDNAAGVDFQQTVNVDSAETSVVLSDDTLTMSLISGETYRVAVIGLDVDGVAGDSSGRTIVTVGMTQSVAPGVGEFPVYAVPGETFTGQLAMEAGDLAELIDGPTGSTVDASTGLFSWDVPGTATGFMDVTIKVTPADGITRFDEYTLFAAGVPTSDITAQTFDDVDRNGEKAPSEIGSNGITVELIDAITGDVLATMTSQDVDLNNDSAIDPATESGIAQFENLNPGRYAVRRSDVSDQDQLLTLADGSTTLVELGDRSSASISGSVFLDSNFDGSGDLPQAGITVGIDLDDDGAIDMETVTAEDDPSTAAIDETGLYHFEDLLSGDFDVIVVPPVDFAAVGSPTRSVSIAADEQRDAVDFSLVLNPLGNAPLAQVFFSDPLTTVFSQIDFGTVLADGGGGEIVTVNLELMNFGDTNLILDSAQVSDDGFTVSGLDQGLVVLPDGFQDTSSSIPFSVSFDPSRSGDVTPTLTIETNDPSGPLIVDLLGTAIADGPELTILTPNNNAGGVPLGSTQTRTSFFALANIGSQDLTVTAIDGSLGFSASALPGDFPAQPIVIAAGQSMSFDLNVTPIQLGLQSGTIQISSDDINQPSQSLFVVTTGVAAAGPQADIGDDFVVISTPELDGSPVLRDTTGPGGEYQFIIAPNVGYEVTIFDPVSGLVAKTLDLSAPSGGIGDALEPAFLASSAPDTDNDTLPDDIERAIGTSITNPDTDGDGLSDFAEIVQGLNPLSGLLVGTGIIAGVPLLGEANEVVLPGGQDGTQLAYVATGSHGLAIVDVSDVLSPIVLGQLDLSGTATDVDVDLELGIAFVAASSEFHLVDISDPMIPTLVQTIASGAARVEVFGGVAFFAGGTTLASADLSTGQILQSVQAGTITDVVRLGNFLYTMEAQNTLRTFELEGLTITERGSLNLVNGGGRLFVGDGIAYAMASDRPQGGFTTIDVSDPSNPVLISDSDVTTGVAPRLDVIPNGSGLGIVLGNPLQTPILDVVDLSDPANTNIFDDTFRSRVSLPSAPVSGTIGGGIAFVANGTSGLQVVNFLAFDDQETPPTVSLTLPDLDVDALAEGIQVFEGTTLPLIASVTDDVQVRSVDLLINGQLIASDISFPFDLTTIAPTLDASETVRVLTIQARATDTGGNMAVTDPIMLSVVEDTVPPSIDAISITEGATVDAGVVAITIDFSEALDETTINSTSFDLSGTVVGNVSPLGILISPDSTSARVTYLLNEPDGYQFTIDAPLVTDRAGNPLGATPVITNFLVSSPRGDATPLSLFPEILVPGTGRDVVVGDFSGDGVPDLVSISDTVASSITITIGRGDNTFEEPQNLAVAANPRSIIQADFNNDQELDVLVAGSTADLSLLLGLGDGTFASQALVPIGIGFASALTAVDINQDGFVDVVALRSNFGVTELRVLLGGGDGSFSAVETFSFAGIGIARSLTVADFDNDGDLDVAASGTRVGVVLGNGDGTFGSVQTFNGIGGVVTSLDVNDDNNIDLINSNSSNDISISLGGGDGTFAAATTIATSGGAIDMLVTDLNGDGVPDIATLSEQVSGATLLTQLSVVLGDGSGGFGAETTATISGFPEKLISADINLDGNVDLVIAGDTVGNGRNATILVGKGDGTFATQGRVVAGFDPANPGVLSFPTAVAIGDFNGDSLSDLVTANPTTDDISLLLGNGDGSFTDQVKFIVGDSPIDIVVGDFNNDSKLDVVTLNLSSSDVTFLAGDGQGGFSTSTSIAIGTSALNNLETADLDNNGSLDLVIGSGSNTVFVLLGQGDGTFAAPVPIDAGSSPLANTFVQIADLNDDGVLDILSDNRSISSSLAVLVGAGDGTFATGAVIANTTSTLQAVTGDINNDGLDDIAAVNFSDLVILLGQAGGGFSAPAVIGQFTGGIDGQIAIQDVNGDSTADILVTRFPDDNVEILLGNGAGAFASPVSFGAGDRPREMAFADFNGDEAIDIVLVNSEGRDLSVLLNGRPPSTRGEGESTADALLIVARPKQKHEDTSPLETTMIDDFLRSLPNWKIG